MGKASFFVLYAAQLQVFVPIKDFVLYVICLESVWALKPRSIIDSKQQRLEIDAFMIVDLASLVSYSVSD